MSEVVPSNRNIVPVVHKVALGGREVDPVGSDAEPFAPEAEPFAPEADPFNLEGEASLSDATPVGCEGDPVTRNIVPADHKVVQSTGNIVSVFHKLTSDELEVEAFAPRAYPFAPGDEPLALDGDLFYLQGEAVALELTRMLSLLGSCWTLPYFTRSSVGVCRPRGMLVGR